MKLGAQRSISNSPQGGEPCARISFQARVIAFGLKLSEAP